MCRLAAYLGPPISLGEFLLEPEHSLVRQSWQPREMRSAKLNADGFGFAWYAEDGKPACYKSTKPIWADPNLESLARSLVRSQWLANIRAATLVSDHAYANTQPFIERGIAFTHNGFLANFADNWRGQIRQRLQPEHESCIHGTTDSEYLFALFLQHYAGTGNLADALANLVKELGEIAKGYRAMLNFIICSNQQLVALRHAFGDESPSLYYHLEESENGSVVRVASEPLTTDDNWIRMDEGQLLVADDAGISSRVL